MTALEIQEGGESERDRERERSVVGWANTRRTVVHARKRAHTGSGDAGTFISRIVTHPDPVNREQLE